MSTLQEEIKKHIKILVHPLKEEEALKLALKAKLTKKEFKLLNAWAMQSDLDTLRQKLKLDDTRYEELSGKLIKKLNQEKVKQAICD